jgi:hypothetical protein
MRFNIGKCGILSESDHNFYLGEDLLPAVTTYKYLGFPHIQSGICWISHATALASKANGHLTSLSGVIHLWSPGIKLAVYRAFIRPQLEYGAPLLYHWNRLTLPTSAPHLATMAKTHRTGVQWICATSFARIALSLTGLPPLPQRFFALACTFTHHLRRLDSNNPCTKINDSYQSAPLWPAGTLLPSIYSHDPCRLLPAVTFGSTLTSRLHASNLHSLDTLGPLASCILPLSRKFRKSPDGITITASVGPDRLLSHPDPQFLLLALKWRLNIFGLHMKCSVCSSPFRRTHVAKCNLLATLALTDPILSDFQQELTTLVPRVSVVYTMIDFLLNQRYYELADSAFHILFTHLISPIPP